MMMSASTFGRFLPSARRVGASLWTSRIGEFFSPGRGLRAAWQEWRKTLAGLHRSAATTRGSRWQSILRLATDLGAWVRRAIDRAQARRVDVGVALGGRQAGVPQQLLDGAQVAAGRQQVGREGMAQRMRRHLLVEAEP